MFYHLFLTDFSLQSYLNTFAFKNTVYTDLWDHLQRVGEFKKKMNTPLPQICTIPVGIVGVHVFLLVLLSVCFQAVESTPGLNIPHSVHDIMNRWTLQMGFPVVTIDTRTGRITQKHFLLDPESVVERPSQFEYEPILPHPVDLIFTINEKADSSIGHPSFR